MRTRLTDPLEIAKAYIEGKNVYVSLDGRERELDEVNFWDLKYSKNLEYWIEQTTWQDDLKPILDAKWVTVEEYGDKWLPIDMFAPKNKERCLEVRGKWYSYEEAMQRIKPVEE